MNLQGLTPPLISKISGFQKRFGVTLSPYQAFNRLDKLIVLGDGTPDDYAIFLISHHLNGSDTVGIVKPSERTGTATFESIRSYLKNPSLKGLLFLLDQEERTSDSISEELEQRVKKSNIEFVCCNEGNQGRLRIYDCSTGTRQFSLILVLNGLTDIDANKHTVEDHLLKVASELGFISLPQKIADPKNHWHTKVSSQTQETVLKKLAGNKTLTRDIFPQQTEGCRLLKVIGKQ